MNPSRAAALPWWNARNWDSARWATRARNREGVAAQRVKTEVLVRDKRQSRVRVDTVYVEKRDSVMVQNKGLTNPTNTTKGSGFRATLKWIFWILIGLIGLIITMKVCTLRR